MCMKYEEYVKLRDEKGISDYQVSKDTGISRSTFTQWKKGVLTPAPHTQARLTKYFNEYDATPLPYLPVPPSRRVEPMQTTSTPLGLTVSSYVVEFPRGYSITLNGAEYERLQADLESFLLKWASEYGKI